MITFQGLSLFKVVPRLYDHRKVQTVQFPPTSKNPVRHYYTNSMKESSAESVSVTPLPPRRTCPALCIKIGEQSTSIKCASGLFVDNFVCSTDACVQQAYLLHELWNMPHLLITTVTYKRKEQLRPTTTPSQAPWFTAYSASSSSIAN